MSFNAAETKDRLVQWIRDWFKVNGRWCNAVVGISGGKDSSVVAALCVEALGKDRVIGIMMPQGVQSDIEYSQMLCDHLGIEHYTVNIFNACRDIKHEIRDELGGKTDEDNLGFTYDMLDEYLRTGVCKDEAVRQIIDEMHEKNVFKLAPMPKFISGMWIEAGMELDD